MKSFRSLFVLIPGLSFLALASLPAQTPPATPVNLMRGGDMERFTTVVNKWGGVDSTDTLKGLTAESKVVTSQGNVDTMPYPVSVAVADLTGDKIPDLVVADPKGYFWFYPNGGTEKEPKFGFGEVIPIFLTGAPDSFRYKDLGVGGCNKVSLCDFDGDGLYDLIVGDAIGRIYFLKNMGAAAAPKFLMPRDPVSAAFKLNTRDQLKGNFFAPLTYDWNGDGKNDLIWGDGTYSANNITLAINAGSNLNPKFTEETQSTLIKGLGKEHLTPQIVDWNGDGKPDILTGERDGTISIYLNTSTSKTATTFADPQAVMIGSTTKMGNMAVAVPGDMNGDKLVDLLFGRTSGKVEMSLNKGTATAPKFDAPIPVKGTNPYPKLAAPTSWDFNPPMRSSYEIMKTVGADPTDVMSFEPNFTPSPGSPIAATDLKKSHALKIEFSKPMGTYFNQEIPMDAEASSYELRWQGGLNIKPDTKYELSFWHKGSGFTNPHIGLYGTDRFIPQGKDDDSAIEEKFTVDTGFSTSSGWSQFKHTFRIKKTKIENKNSVSMYFTIYLNGHGTFYLDDVVLQQAD
jgi:hypothetical protein